MMTGGPNAKNDMSIPDRAEKDFAQIDEFPIGRSIFCLQLSNFQPVLDLNEVNKPFQQI
jgi:hypothetical protein